MTKNEKMALMQNRINILKNRKNDNTKIITKLERKLKKM